MSRGKGAQPENEVVPQSGELDVIKTKKLQRFRMLRYIYYGSAEHKGTMFDSQDLAQALNIDKFDAERMAEYLVGEGLASSKGFDNGMVITIAHRGIVAFEEAVEHPEQDTYYFPAVINIINIENSTVSGLHVEQSGSPPQL